MASGLDYSYAWFSFHLGTTAQEYLHNFFGDIIKKIVEDETLSLEIDPKYVLL